MSVAERTSQRTARVAIAVTVAMMAVTVMLVPSATAGPLDGTYTGTFTGDASGTVEFWVVDNEVTVMKPGAGSGTISGSNISMVVGEATVNGMNCRYESTGSIAMGSGNTGTASGTWSASCTNGAVGYGNWQATRPAPSGSPSPSSTLQPRTLSLSAKPKVLSEVGKTRLTAQLSDCSSETTIEFQVRRDGVFQTVASAPPVEACTASVRRRVTKRTSFRAFAPAEDSFAEATSRVVTVRIDS